MTISATIPVEHVNAANAKLDELGFGPNNFSIPLRDGAEAATHAGLHCWDNPEFLTALQSLSYTGLVIRPTQEDEDTNEVMFGTHCTEQSLEWSDPTFWFENPVMTGDQREHGGKTWESLVDYNVWEPPVGWREVVSEGYPNWVQPTGAHDAYDLGDRVTHNGSDWESDYAANVWEPGVFGWTTL